MNCLKPEEYETFDLPADTPEWKVAYASGLICGICRRPTLLLAIYTERLRVSRADDMVRLTQTPLAPEEVCCAPIIAARGRIAGSAPAEGVTVMPAAQSLCCWIDIDVMTLNYFSDTGVLSWAQGEMDAIDLLEICYSAGYAEVPEAVKYACAALVIDSSALANDDWKAGLAPYVLQR